MSWVRPMLSNKPIAIPFAIMSGITTRALQQINVLMIFEEIFVLVILETTHILIFEEFEPNICSCIWTVSSYPFEHVHICLKSFSSKYIYLNICFVSSQASKYFWILTLLRYWHVTFMYCVLYFSNK